MMRWPIVQRQKCWRGRWQKWSKGIAFVAVLLALLASTQASHAQNEFGQSNTVLVVRLEKVFANSEFGKNVTGSFAADGAVLAQENQRIMGELIAEEKALADQRPTMDPAEFRKLADVFDDKVQQIRKTQDDKVRALGKTSDAAKIKFFDLAQPVLEEIMRKRGAVIILERDSAILSLNTIDITDEAIARIDLVTQASAVPESED